MKADATCSQAKLKIDFALVATCKKNKTTQKRINSYSIEFYLTDWNSCACIKKHSLSKIQVATKTSKLYYG
jgi:hypothetical protein